MACKLLVLPMPLWDLKHEAEGAAALEKDNKHQVSALRLLTTGEKILLLIMNYCF